MINAEIIKATLADIEHQENIKILFAVESGSRAWGFASPDSDWDVRFVYVRPTKDYLRLKLMPDEIDRKHERIGWSKDLPEDLDLVGWDSKKALTLMLSGNHTSPITRSLAIRINFGPS